MAIPIYTKDPNAIETFGVDWSERLEDATIETSSWTLPSGITNTGDSISGQTAMIILSGGTAGNSYQLTNRITTSSGETLDQSIKIAVIQK